jgi:hypothetical protein
MRIHKITSKESWHCVAVSLVDEEGRWNIYRTQLVKFLIPIYAEMTVLSVSLAQGHVGYFVCLSHYMYEVPR